MLRVSEYFVYASDEKDNALKRQHAAMACPHATFLEPKSILHKNFRGKLGFTDSERVARAAVELPAGSVSSAALAAETQTPLSGCTLQKGLAQVTLTDVLTIDTFCLCDLGRC